MKNNTTTDLKFTIASQLAFPYITSKEDYFVLMANPVNGSEVQYISSGKTRLGTLGIERPEVTYSDDKPYESGFRSSASYGDDGTILVADITGDTLLFRDSTQQKPLTRLDLAAAKRAVDACVKTTADSSEYISDTTTFQIFFMGEDNLAGKVSSFSNCIDKSNRQVLLGYGFRFAARDPGNGRITTD